MEKYTMSRTRPFSASRCLRNVPSSTAPSEDCRTGLFVERLPLEDDLWHCEGFERVRQEQQLGIDIGTRALRRIRQPGGTDLQAPVRGRNTHEARRANNGPVRPTHNDERQTEIA